MAALSSGIHTRLFALRRHAEQRRLRRRLAALERGHQPVRLWELVSPFRYDIEVRRDFLAFIRNERALWGDDPQAFLEEARGTTYHRWYETVAVRSIGVDATDADELARGFERRVRKSVAFSDEFQRRGSFDPRYPVTLRRAPAVVGARKHLSTARMLPVDGCHRLAMLLLEGRYELDVTEYRIAPAEAPALDNTEQLVAELGVEPEDYYRFISRGFLDEEYAERHDILTAVAATDPRLAAELDEIMRIDEASMRAASS